MSSYIHTITYNLGDVEKSVEELLSAGLCNSSVDFLKTMGFTNVRTASSANYMAESVLQQIADHSSVLTPSTVLFYSGIPQDQASTKLLELFTYNSSRMMYESGLNGVRQLTVSQNGCSGAFETIELATRLQEPNKTVMCVMSDMIPMVENREVQYNLMSDAVSVITVGSKGWLKITGTHTLNAQQFWNTAEDIDRITASYFTFATRCIQDALTKFGMSIKDIDLIIPHNVNLKSWNILGEILGFEAGKVYTKNISRVGHTVSSDLAINLVDARAEGLLHSGMKLLAFTYGFGSSWSVLLLEVV